MTSTALHASLEVITSNHGGVFYSFFGTFTYRDLYMYVFFLNQLNSLYVYYLVTFFNGMRFFCSFLISTSFFLKAT